MLGFEVAQSTVSKYMVRGGSPSQSWKTFFRNHAQAIVAIDLFVVPTLTFERLFAFLVVGHRRRQLLWFEVTRHPTADWLARQITEAFPWASAPGLPGAGQRPCLRTGLHVTGEGDGHPRPTDLASIAVAKSVCRASDGTVRRECLSLRLMIELSPFQLIECHRIPPKESVTAYQMVRI